MKNFITSESVTEWHPDKLCDQISDSILDACLSQDPYSRVACETATTTDFLILLWEITTQANINFEQIARQTILWIGYDSAEKYFDGKKCKIENLLHKQSPDIAQWVDIGWAWDQGIMYWYATNETENYMPLPIDLAHKLAKKLSETRKNNILPFLYPDGKTQVTVEYENDKPIRIDTIVTSTQHSKSISQEEIKNWVIEHVIKPVVGNMIDENTKYYINPTWIFNIGGPYWDAGLTWRKIIIDTYGGVGRHGGGAFSGKDSTKVDRSWAYIARYLAKNIVASWICDKCEIQLAYAIWVVQPVSIYINCFGTEKISTEQIAHKIQKNFDLSPAWIIKKLDLRKPKFQQTASYWHFGRPEFSRENLDSVWFFQ